MNCVNSQSIREWIKRWGHISLTAEIAELAEKKRGILSVLCGLSSEMVSKAHEHSHSHPSRSSILSYKSQWRIPDE
jgi:hypothetical protein